MWPIFKKKSLSQKRVDSIQTLVESAGTLAFLESNDAWVKFWLPSLVAEAIKDCSRYHGETMAKHIRKALLRHCYGDYVFVHIEQLKSRITTGNLSETDFVASYAYVKDPIYWVPHLGKNVFPVRLAVPKRTKIDLETLAERKKVPLSQYIRETVISIYFGQGMIPERFFVLDERETNRADSWCLQPYNFIDNFTDECKPVDSSENGNGFYFDDE